MFGRNNEKVPGISRVMDTMVSSFQSPNTVNFSGFGLVISNYTVSYNLAKRVDFWDTNEESITEDIHFTQKVGWKTQGEVITVAIFVPVNEMNI